MVLKYLSWMALLVKIVFQCTAIAPLAYILNFNLILDQACYALSTVDCAGYEMGQPGLEPETDGL